MIAVEQALELILQKARPLEKMSHNLEESLGMVLAENIRSAIDSPPFHQSAMDGYAIRYSDLHSYPELALSGEVITGNKASQSLKAGQAIRVFTGAMIPPGADTVVIQELVTLSANGISVADKALVKAGANIRKRGSQIHKGALALPKGTVLNPASIGYLATLGISQVKLFRKPNIGVIATGNELQLPGKALEPGQIYESNTIMLSSLLAQMQIKAGKVYRVKDKEPLLLKTILKALENSDVLLLSGGISVGDYDLVEPALKSAGVKKIFHKVAQKPGKPFYFGVKGKKLVFALPGNPASVMTCFYEYVYPALQKMSGRAEWNLRSESLLCKNEYRKKSGLTHFMKGLAVGNEVEILEGQESYLLNSYARANCLVMLPASSQGAMPGEKVIVHYIDRI